MKISCRKSLRKLISLLLPETILDLYMKKIFSIAIIIFIYSAVNAQDTIVKYNGDKIFVKVSDISSSEIKYKRTDFPDGPSYSISKNDVQLIKYANGTREFFEKSTETQTPVKKDEYVAPVVKKEDNKIYDYGLFFKYQRRPIRIGEVYSILQNAPEKEVKDMVILAKKDRNLSFISLGAIPFGLGAAAFGISALINRDSSYLAGGVGCLLVAVACPITGGIFKHKSTMKIKDAIDVYNQTR